MSTCSDKETAHCAGNRVYSGEHQRKPSPSANPLAGKRRQHWVPATSFAAVSRKGEHCPRQTCLQGRGDNIKVLATSFAAASRRERCIVQWSRSVDVERNVNFNLAHGDGRAPLAAVDLLPQVALRRAASTIRSRPDRLKRDCLSPARTRLRKSA